MCKFIFRQRPGKGLLISMVILSMAAIYSPLAAQTARVVQGVVVDEKKEPIAGTTVAVKQTNAITSTGDDGRFSLSVPAGKHKLVVTYVGKIAQEISIRNQNNIIITLKDSSAGLDEVIGLGSGKPK